MFELVLFKDIYYVKVDLEYFIGVRFLFFWVFARVVFWVETGGL